MVRSRFSLPVIAIFASLLGGDALGTPVEARSEAQKYPFDPACAWGRLADGRGLIVRCLTRDESERLSKRAPVAGNSVPTAVSSSSATDPSAISVASKATPIGGAPGPVASASALPQPSTTAETPAPASTPPAATGGASTGSSDRVESLTAEVVSVAADDGELPLAKKKFSAALQRYTKCVADFGGLSAVLGQAEIRFLVRERGRAEGTSVARFQGMSEAAANCIAQVVDRRPTGTPDAPVVGATATIRVRKRAVK